MQMGSTSRTMTRRRTSDLAVLLVGFRLAPSDKRPTQKVCVPPMLARSMLRQHVGHGKLDSRNVVATGPVQHTGSQAEQHDCKRHHRIRQLALLPANSSSKAGHGHETDCRPATTFPTRGWLRSRQSR